MKVPPPKKMYIVYKYEKVKLWHDERRTNHFNILFRSDYFSQLMKSYFNT